MFKEHVDKLNAKARRVAGHLRSLGNTKYGPPPHALRRAVKACVMPVALYGAEAWWPGKTRQTAQGQANTKTKYLVNQLARTTSQALRAVLPVWKTTPLTCLYRDAGIMPVSLQLEAARLRQAVRTKLLDTNHPLVLRAQAPPRRTNRGNPRPPTRLQGAYGILPKCPRPQLV